MTLLDGNLSIDGNRVGFDVGTEGSSWGYRIGNVLPLVSVRCVPATCQSQFVPSLLFQTSLCGIVDLKLPSVDSVLLLLQGPQGSKTRHGSLSIGICMHIVSVRGNPFETLQVQMPSTP